MRLGTTISWVLTLVWIGLSTAFAGAQPTPGSQPVTAWLRSNSSSIASVTPTRDASDLQPLRAALDTVRIVGLGEATHGTREFFQLKHRVLQYLVTELGFTVLAMESPSADTEALNDYVMDGTGDVATALTAQGYTAWDTEEVTAMMEWLRDHNTHVAANRKVRVVGLDIVFHTKGRARVLEYLRRHAPARVSDTQAVFRTLSEEQDAFPVRHKPERIAATGGHLEALRDFLIGEQKRLGSGSPHELDAVVRDTERMVQRAVSIDAAASGLTSRSEFMGQNALELLTRNPQDKLVVWAHNSHVSIRSPVDRANLGSRLREALGPAYYAVGLEFGKGSTQMRRADAEGLNGPLEEVVVEAPPAGSLPWQLSQVLRASRTPEIDQWLTQPIPAHSIAWLNRPGSVRITEDFKVGQFDGLFFVETASMARPTKNALARVAKREGF